MENILDWNKQQGYAQPNSYPSGFIGPVRPGDTVGGQSAYNAGYVGLQQPSGGQVLGASTGPSDSGGTNYQQQWEQAGHPGIAPAGYHGEAQAPSQDQILSEINNLYSGSNDYLNQAEGAVRADFPNALAEAQSTYDVNASQLGNQRQGAFNNLNQQKGKATSTYENALADARRMYQEQGMGANQRFGGSSSAGQAYSEIQSREQARQFGQTGRQYADLTQQIETQRNTVENEYQTGLMQLNQQKQSAITNATRDFQNKLLQISNNRAQIGQAKAEARLGALQQLRSEVFAIEQQNTQFAQTLEAQRQSALLSLGNFSGVAQGAQQRATNTVSGYNPQMTAPYAATGGLNGQSAQTMTGQISTRRPEDLYSNMRTSA